MLASLAMEWGLVVLVDWHKACSLLLHAVGGVCDGNKLHVQHSGGYDQVLSWCVCLDGWVTNSNFECCVGISTILQVQHERAVRDWGAVTLGWKKCARCETLCRLCLL